MVQAKGPDRQNAGFTLSILSREPAGRVLSSLVLHEVPFYSLEARLPE